MRIPPSRKIIEHPAIQTAVLTIPIVGPYVSSILSIWMNDTQQRRLRNFIIEMASEMQTLEESRVDFNYFRSEEFEDLMMLIAERSSKTRHHEKYRMFCQILRSVSTFEGKAYRRYAEDCVDIVSDLSPSDMVLAAKIFEQQETMPKTFPKANPTVNELLEVKDRGWANLQKQCRLSEVALQLSLVKLERQGLIRELVGYLDNAGQGIYIITPVFRKFAELIRTTSQQPIFTFEW
jgi:hypothetical protein